MNMVQKNRESQLVIRCTEELRAKVDELAGRNGQSVAEWVRRAVINEIERQTGTTSNEDMIRRIVREEMAASKNITQTIGGDNVNQNINIK